VRNRTGQGPKGANRHEGSQTLKAKHSGSGTARHDVDLRFRHVLKGAKVHERCRRAVAFRPGVTG
jgi:hypothetical protein